MSRFSEMKPAGENPQNIPEKIIQNEPIVTSIEDLLNIQKSAANETALVSQMLILIDKCYYSKARKNTNIIVTWRDLL